MAQKLFFRLQDAILHLEGYLVVKVNSIIGLVHLLIFKLVIQALDHLEDISVDMMKVILNHIGAMNL